MLAWTEQVKCKGLSEQSNFNRVVTKPCNMKLVVGITLKRKSVNHNSSTALERSVINNLGGGGLNRFYMAITSPSASAVVHNI